MNLLQPRGFKPTPLWARPQNPRPPYKPLDFSHGGPFKNLVGRLIPRPGQKAPVRDTRAPAMPESAGVAWRAAQRQKLLKRQNKAKQATLG